MRGVCDHGCRAVRRFIPIERGNSRFHRVRQLFSVLEYLPAFEQLVFFSGLQLGAFNFIDLEFQRFDQTQLFRFVHGQAADLLLHDADLVVRLPVIRQQRFVMGIQVEIADMRRLIEQLLGIVLAMDLDELDAELPKRGDCDGLAADAAAVFPSAKISREMPSSGSYGIWFSANHGSSGTPEKIALTNAFCAPVRIISREARSPKWQRSRL